MGRAAYPQHGRSPPRCKRQRGGGGTPPSVVRVLGRQGLRQAAVARENERVVRLERTLNSPRYHEVLTVAAHTGYQP